MLVRMLVVSLAIQVPLSADASQCLDSSITNACNGGDTSDICYLTTTVSTNDTLSCHLAANGDTSAADIHAVYDGTLIEVFGTDADGNDFCCLSSPSSSLWYVKIEGSTQGDSIDLQYVDGSSTYDLENASGKTMVATVKGDDGIDFIYGSNSTSAAYEEDLHGDDGNDTIHGRAGNDDIYGGDDIDTVWAGDGNDYVDGGHHTDYLHGENGQDDLIGREGDDHLFGEAGDDVLCGGLNDSAGDHLEGGPGSDTLWGPDASGADGGDYRDGDGDWDGCDFVGGGGFFDCDTEISEPPSVCP